jgi:hypothetical protein
MLFDGPSSGKQHALNYAVTLVLKCVAGGWDAMAEGTIFAGSKAEIPIMDLEIGSQVWSCRSTCLESVPVGYGHAVDLDSCLESVLALYILYICTCENFVMLVKRILSIYCFLSGI